MTRDELLELVSQRVIVDKVDAAGIDLSGADLDGTSSSRSRACGAHAWWARA